MVGLVCLCEFGSGGISSPDKSADCTLVRLRSAASLLAILHTPSCADTPIQPAPTRQGTSSTKTSTVHVRPNIRYPQTAYPRTLVLCWTVGSRSEMSFSRTGRTTHRWRTTVGERVLYAKCAWMAPEHRTSETMTKSDDWSVVLVFYLAIAMIRDCEPHLSHNNILNALER